MTEKYPFKPDFSVFNVSSEKLLFIIFSTAVYILLYQSLILNIAGSFLNTLMPELNEWSTFLKK